MRNLTTIALCISIFIVACNNHPLVEKNAKQQIIEYYKENPEKLRGTVSFEPVIRGRDSGYDKKLFNFYITGGLLKLREQGNSNPDSIYVYEISEKGKPWLIKESQSKSAHPVLTVKTFEYYVDSIEEIKYSPHKDEAYAAYTLSITNITPFGDGPVDPNHKMHWLGFFRFVNNAWIFERVEIDPSRLLD